MEILEHYNLKNDNTFACTAFADYFVRVGSEDDVTGLFQSGLLSGKKHFILGAGSNVLFSSDFNAVVISMRNKGYRILSSDSDSIIIAVSAGESWHDFVSLMIASNYFGLENLALIPGKCGASPVQNIGAYGAEQMQFCHSVRGFNLQTSSFEDLDAGECRFSYRDSIFKHELKDNFLVTEVRYKLSKKENLNLSYKELSLAFQSSGLPPTAANLFNIVCSVRRSKLPAPELLPNAGSFFKNPVISESDYQIFHSEHPEIEAYKTSVGLFKISAARLIDSLGWRGKRFGDAGVYEKHALVLVNHGSASGQDILSLASQIISSVYEQYRIKLEPEVIII